MHLLTLGAYWHPVTVNDTSRVRVLLNVPFSARCFLTFPRLNTRRLSLMRVLMYLLALGAF